MTNCTNCDQVNDLWDENNKLKKAYDEVCEERDKLKDKILSIQKLVNTPQYGSVERCEYNYVCDERDKLKEENKSLYRLCNQLLAEQRGESEDESND